MKVPTRRFGRTEVEIPVLSCGGMRYQQSWDDMDAKSIILAGQENIEAVIHQALDYGIKKSTGKSSIEHALSFAEKHNPERKKVKCVNFLEITETEVCSILKERVTELRSQINKSSKIKILD